jgi:hypothetical protein
MAFYLQSPAQGDDLLDYLERHGAHTMSGLSARIAKAPACSRRLCLAQLRDLRAGRSLIAYDH